MIKSSSSYLKNVLVICQFETNTAGLKIELLEEYDKSFCVTEGTVFRTRPCNFYE